MEKLDEALGAVLFIDEAYRLVEGNFATDAVNTLVDSLTKPKYMGKMLVVLAGYEQGMNDLLKVNPGLSSRFPEEIIFKNMQPEDCFKLLRQKLAEEDIVLDVGAESLQTLIVAKFQALCELPSWGNGRDVKTLAKSTARSTYQAAGDDPDDEFSVSLSDLVGYLDAFLLERLAREKSSGLPFRSKLSDLPTAQDVSSSRLTETRASTAAARHTVEPDDAKGPPEAAEIIQEVEDYQPERDAGVSDIIWQQLQHDEKTQNALREEANSRMKTDLEAIRTAEVEAECAAAELSLLRQQMDRDKESEKLKRQHESMRLEHLAARRAREEAAESLRVAEERKKQEARVQTKLRDMGVCPVGFQWIKASGGYRCAGGSHFVSAAQLGIE